MADSITHQQALDKLAARQLVPVIEDDIARLLGKAISYAKHNAAFDLPGFVLTNLMLRWNCILHGTEDEVSENYQDKTALALALLLHKHGIVDTGLQQRACLAIDRLNAKVALSDAFFKNSESIKALLASPAALPKKRPSERDTLTFLRAQDVISLQLAGYYYAAYVHSISGFNEYPVVELYEGRFTHKPDMLELAGRRAQGQTYNDGSKRISHFGVCGMRHVPDPANQFHLIASGVSIKPDNSHLQAATGLYALSDMFSLQTEIMRIFVTDA